MNDHGMFYSVVLFFHVLGAVALFAVLGALLVGMVLMRRASTVEQVRTWAGLAHGIGPVFPVPNVLILLAGLYMAATEWGWAVPWIDVSLVALVVMAVLGRTVIGSRIEKAHEASLAAPEGPIPDALHRRRTDPVLWSTFLSFVAVAVGIVFLMTVKPGLAGALAAIGVAIVIGIAGAAIIRTPRTSPL